MLFPLFDRNPHSRFPWLTLLLILANVGIYFYTIDEGNEGYVKTVYEWGFVPQRLTRVGEAEPVLIDKPFEVEGQQLRLNAKLSTDPQRVYPTLISMMFLHGGLFHLISNMWMLWVFGDNVEDRLGRFVFICFYLLGGIIAVIAQWAVDPMSTQPVIGASGAVAAVLGAYLVTYPNAKVKTLLFIGIPLLLDLRSYIVLGGWFVMQVIAGVNGIMAPANVEVSVAFWAHIGGFVAGVVIMPMLTIGAEPPEKSWRDESEKLFSIE